MKKLAFLLTVAPLVGCASLSTGLDAPELTYGSDAAADMKSGEAAMQGKNFADAEKYFEHVRVKYPYLEVSKDAELRIADAQFEREQYLEARDKYQAFVKLHPTHPKVDYAAFRAALSHYKEIPSDFFFLPSSREKDQAQVVAALKGMTDFLRQYPSSSHEPEARKVADDARRRLADHELYVAEFYAKRNRWNAVVLRLSRLEREYPGIGYDERALFGLHHAYTQLKQPQKAQEALREIINRLPNTDAARKAQRLLGS